jgi:hypothetical protein
VPISSSYDKIREWLRAYDRQLMSRKQLIDHLYREGLSGKEVAYVLTGYRTQQIDGQVEPKTLDADE